MDSEERAASLLYREMTSELARWRRSTRAYGFTYYTTRTILIIASAVVAAKESFAASEGDFLVSWVPVLAIGVAILTAVDTWLKPQNRWQGFMEDRDDLHDLLVQGADGRPVEQLRKDFARLRKRHRDTNVF